MPRSKAMPRAGLSLVQCVALSLRKMDWLERHRQWRRLQSVRGLAEIVRQARLLMAADELLDGEAKPAMADPMAAIALPSDDWKYHDPNHSWRQRSLHEFWQPKPKRAKNKQVKITRFFKVRKEQTRRH